MSRRFFENAAFLVIVEVILKLKGFIFIPLLTRQFGTVNYGVWSQIGIMIGTLSPLLFWGTDSAIFRYLPGLPLDQQRRYYSAWFLFLLIPSIIICTFLLLFKTPIVLTFFGAVEEYERFLPLAAASLMITMAVNVLRNWYRIHNNAKVYGIIAIIQTVLGLVALIAMFLRREGVYELVFYTVIADAIVVFWLLQRIAFEYGWSRPDFTIIKSLLKFGLPILPAGYAMWGLNSMDRLFLVKYSTLSDIGIYALVYSLGYMIIQIFVNPIWNMYPNTAAELLNQGKINELQKLFDRSIGLILLLTFPMLVGMFVLGENLLSILATQAFLSGAPLMAVITCGYLFHILASYYDISLGLVHRQYWSTVSIVAACAVNFVLNFLLIPKYSIAGAAVATCLGFFSQFLLSHLFARRYTEIKTHYLYPMKVAGVSILMGFAVYGLSRLISGKGFVSFIVLVAFGAIFYSTLIIAFKVVEKGMLEPIIVYIKERTLPLWV